MSVVLVSATAVALFVWFQVRAFDKSIEKAWDIPLRELEVTITKQTIARGRHISESIGGCSNGECHGADLGGGTPIDMRPLGRVSGPNLTSGGLGSVYSDAELVRVIEYGVKKDGHSLRFMPSFELSWLSDEDLSALIAFLRTRPAVERAPGPIELGVLWKVMDRQGVGVVLDVARHMAQHAPEKAPPPAPTAEYGYYVARTCIGCHGSTMSGGPIPGAPPDMPIPANITPHETGLKNWSFSDFEVLLDQGIKPDGAKLDAFMPLAALSHMNSVERQALWRYLRTLQARPFGRR
ncbi:MAG: cytochrome c [Polyangiaceae bacterium]|nr:cytochrome c [Polyangiaceae bacterium]